MCVGYYQQLFETLLLLWIKQYFHILYHIILFLVIVIDSKPNQWPGKCI